jgi:prevent-host-death family protein
MAHVTVTEFREHLAKWLDRAHRGDEVEISSRGQLVARLVPAANPQAAARALLKKVRATASVGDIESPIDTDWEASRDRP